MTEIIKIAAGQSVTLDPLQSGFAHGYGLFETIQMRQRKLLFWLPHWARLQHSAQCLGLPLTCSATAVLQAIGELVAADAIDSALIKLSLVREGQACRLFVYVRPLGAVPAVAELRFDPACPINQYSILAGHKTHNYMENMSLQATARAAGAYDVLRVNTAGELAETTIGNIFFVVDGALSTPALATGILPGVIRQEIIALHGATHQGQFHADRIQQAEAAFLTHSGCGILPVSSIVGPSFVQHYASAEHPLLLRLQADLMRAERAAWQAV